jgi:hypothetical protein
MKPSEDGLQDHDLCVVPQRIMAGLRPAEYGRGDSV